ncbi:2-dehydropantoate 2-reductase [Altericroceibacterium spongiae]|uniref:2-dehydropantoate 2-reductase n=1 Tax=Altericroceibacterium spongiae TaxID=2320269 RepID=A0A420ER55_9SPHN|nr:2-dehydropantoate 2-reductase [Altericroceibacterium spongiae]RKF23162.1 2-dehydropantoate 2-reductase [Altericroceibacterium spongiae]
MTNVTILGAGAMGCLYGAALHRAGWNVLLVDVNKEHIDAINANGLEVDTRSGIEMLPLRAVQPTDVDGIADLVVIFTKTFQTDAALKGIAHHIGPETFILSLQNGLGNDETIARYILQDKVLVGVSMLPSDMLGPGRIRSHGEGRSKFYPAFSTDTTFAGKVAEALTKGGLPAELDTDIAAAIWSKAIFNAAMNPLCTLTRRTPGFLGEHEESRAIIRDVVLEGVATANANGVLIEPEPILELTELSARDHADHEPSMLQDIKAGRRTEVDAIDGAIVRAARKTGLTAPATEFLWRMVKLEEAKL